MPVPKPVYSHLYEVNYSAWEMTKEPPQDEDSPGLEDWCERCAHILNATKAGFESLVKYVDIDYNYVLWLNWLLTPVIICFVILPLFILVFIYVSAIVLYIYRAHRNRLMRRLQTVVEQGDYNDFWMAGREIVATMWDAHAWLWYGYELKGLENLPLEGGCMLVYYHGAIPLDYYFLVNRVLLLKGILINSVVDKFLYRAPGLKIILEVFGCTAGTVDSLADMLMEGKTLGISPGGVYEAQLGDHYYNVLWRERLGFAKAAKKARVPIIPVFTVNVREAFRTLPLFSSFWHWFYLRFRVPLRPIFGGFPVKLTTYLGAPIYVQEDDDPEAIRDRVKAGIEKLVKDNQRIPGTIFRGILDRVWKSRQHRD